VTVVRRYAVASSAGAVAALALLAFAPEGARGGFPDGAPPGFTGGFGEPTCQQCHFGGTLNEEGGSLSIEGVPDAYRPGGRYRLVLTLRRGDMERGGFQLAARFADGTAAGGQAGSFQVADERVKVVADAQGRVQYAGHARPGVEPTGEGTSVWVLEWAAPAEAAGPVTFHAAANAADGDESPLGDLVYTTQRTIQPQQK
jgi:hypothetical protein